MKTNWTYWWPMIGLFFVRVCFVRNGAYIDHRTVPTCWAFQIDAMICVIICVWLIYFRSFYYLITQDWLVTVTNDIISWAYRIENQGKEEDVCIIRITSVAFQSLFTLHVCSGRQLNNNNFLLMETGEWTTHCVAKKTKSFSMYAHACSLIA